MHAIQRKFRDRAISTGPRMDSGRKAIFEVANQDLLEVPRPYPQRSPSNRSKSRWAWFEFRDEMYFHSLFYQANKPRRGIVSAAGTQILLSKVVSLSEVRAVTSLLLVRMSPNTVCVRACALVLAVVTCPFVITVSSREHE